MKYEHYTNDEITEILIPKVQGSGKKLVAITMYNSITYQIDGISWDMSPATYEFEDRVTLRKILMIDYYRDKYQIKFEGK